MKLILYGDPCNVDYYIHPVAIELAKCVCIFPRWREVTYMKAISFEVLYNVSLHWNMFHFLYINHFMTDLTSRVWVDFFVNIVFSLCCYLGIFMSSFLDKVLAVIDRKWLLLSLKIGLSVLSMCQFFFLIDRSNHLGYDQVRNKWANLIVVWLDWPNPDHLLLTTNTRISPLIILALYVGFFGREAIFFSFSLPDSDIASIYEVLSVSL